MPKEHRPRHGSMGFSPRKRSESPIPHFSSWPDIDGGTPRLQGFAGYKAGMTHAIVVDYRPTSTTSGQEVQVPVTIVEVPPMRVAAVRLYRRVPEGLKTAAEVWAAQLEKELRRVFPIPKDYDAEQAWSKVDATAIDEVRVITYTQPSLVTGVPKKKPDLMENRVGGGSIEDRIKYARGLLGKEIPVTEFCREGSMVDVAAITKGKGWKGHHTRWGTRLLSHLGHTPAESQELEAPTEHRHARKFPAGLCATDGAARRPVRLPSTDGVQQADSENRRQGGRGHAGRRLPPLRESSESVRPAARIDPRAHEAPHSIPRCGSWRIRETREIPGSHVHLPRIEARGVTPWRIRMRRRALRNPRKPSPHPDGAYGLRRPRNQRRPRRRRRPPKRRRRNERRRRSSRVKFTSTRSMATSSRQSNSRRSSGPMSAWI